LSIARACVCNVNGAPVPSVTGVFLSLFVACIPSAPETPKVSYVSNRAGTFDLYSIGLDGTKDQRLTWTGETDEFSPSWSPDGEQIAFTARAGFDYRLCLLEVRTGEVRSYDLPFSISASPDWAPDGTQIVFAAGVAVGASELYVLDVASGSYHQVTELGAGAAGPTWSGDWIYFMSNHQLAVSFWLYRIRLDGSQLEFVHSAGYMIGRSSSNLRGYAFAYLLSGSSYIKVYQDGVLKRIVEGWEPGLDSTGETMVFARGFPPDVWSINLETGDETQLTDNEDQDCMPEVTR